MATKTFVSRAPTRIDLAGGTVDLWPLYLFLDHPVTLNLAIDLFADAKVEISDEVTGRSGEVLLRSEDQDLEMKVPWNKLESFIGPDRTQAPPALELHFRLLDYFVHRRVAMGQKELAFDLTLSTRARSPAGAGLGGSSALSVAIVGALANWVFGSLDRDKDGMMLVEIVRDIETRVINVPAGLQDYYGAMYGGLQALHWQPGTHRRQLLPQGVLEELEKRLVLFYSGQSRNSGINNWALFKAFIDNQQGVRDRFQKIVDAAWALERALSGQDWQAASDAIAEEWSVRKSLAPGISTPDIDAAFSAAKEVTAVSGKVCGAGGGGCFFLLLPSEDPALKTQVVEVVKSQGLRHLPFRACSTGLVVDRGLT